MNYLPYSIQTFGDVTHISWEFIMSKIPDGINTKEKQYQQLVEVWEKIKDNLKSTEEMLTSYSVTELSFDKVQIEVFGMAFFVIFSHNFSRGCVSYIHIEANESAMAPLLSVQFDGKGKLSDPYAKFSVNEFAKVNYTIIDSLTSVNRMLG